MVSVLTEREMTCPKCGRVEVLTQADLPTGRKFEDVAEMICGACGTWVNLRTGLKARPRRDRPRMVIRAFRQGGGSFWHWMWRCDGQGLLSQSGCGAGTSGTASHREALEGARAHAWLKHGVRL